MKSYYLIPLLVIFVINIDDCEAEDEPEITAASEIFYETEIPFETNNELDRRVSFWLKSVGVNYTWASIPEEDFIWFNVGDTIIMSCQCEERNTYVQWYGIRGEQLFQLGSKCFKNICTVITTLELFDDKMGLLCITKKFTKIEKSRTITLRLKGSKTINLLKSTGREKVVEITDKVIDFNCQHSLGSNIIAGMFFNSITASSHIGNFYNVILYPGTRLFCVHYKQASVGKYEERQIITYNLYVNKTKPENFNAKSTTNSTGWVAIITIAVVTSGFIIFLLFRMIKRKPTRLETVELASNMENRTEEPIYDYIEPVRQEIAIPEHYQPDKPEEYDYVYQHITPPRPPKPGPEYAYVYDHIQGVGEKGTVVF